MVPAFDPAAPSSAGPAAPSSPGLADPEVDLLPDVPISGPADDLFARAPVARRLVELALATPVAQPRVVALVGQGGAGKSSLLRLVASLLADRAEVAVVHLDAAAVPGAAALWTALAEQLTALFAAAGAVDMSDAVRDRVAGYGSVVSGLAKIAGVKVDVGDALRRTPEQVRAELIEMTQEVGKRVVVVLDHLDRLPTAELRPALELLRRCAEIPYLAVVLAFDRQAVARRLNEAGADPAALARAIEVELALPPVERTLLARLVAGGAARVLARLGRELDPVIELFDPDGGVLVGLLSTARDGKRAYNAIAAAAPLLPTGPALGPALVELVLRLMVPELDGPDFDPRAGDRARRQAALTARMADHPRAVAIAAALRVVFEAA
ncbi:MAG: AAA family ATPase [Kofleriaceae bacterium]|nr:AAA family ATPase [Kofleriaceae bacterium]MBP9204421.1 AAA family ATPase [Kofleriaceae bacterium]